MSDVAFKCIGFGQVIQQFLLQYPIVCEQFRVEIYTRSVVRDTNNYPKTVSFFSIDDFIPSRDIVVIAASCDEASQLGKSKNKDRRAVLEPNRDIIHSLSAKGCFEQGLVFLLTNPTELLAELIYSSVDNQHVYSLGHYTDHLRYKKIVALRSSIEHVNLIGVHYLNPLCVHETLDIQSLEDQYVGRVKEEFKGHKPPVAGGVSNLLHLVESYIVEKPIKVSGYSRQWQSFVLGEFSFSTSCFYPSLVSEENKDMFLGKLNAHKDNVERLVSTKI